MAFKLIQAPRNRSIRSSSPRGLQVGLSMRWASPVSKHFRAAQNLNAPCTFLSCPSHRAPGLPERPPEGGDPAVRVLVATIVVCPRGRGLLLRRQSGRVGAHDYTMTRRRRPILSTGWSARFMSSWPASRAGRSLGWRRASGSSLTRRGCPLSIRQGWRSPSAYPADPGGGRRRGRGLQPADAGPVVAPGF